MAAIKPRRGTSAPSTGLSQYELAVDTTNKRIYVGNVGGSGDLIGSAPGGSDTYIQFNDGGNLGGDSGLTFNKTTDTVTVAGDLAVNGGDITTTLATATLMNATATTLSIGGAATTLTLGATSGTTAIRNASTKLGNTTAQITTNSGTTNSLTINPYGSLVLSPINTGASSGGTNANLTITNTNDGVGTVAVTGGDLVLGTKNTDEFTVSAVNIIFEGATANAFDTTLTVTDPTANRTITLPNLTGTVALTTDLSQFAATTSAQLAGVISDETGSGALVFATSPTLVTPTLGAATATSLTAGNTGVKVGEHISKFLTITSDGTNNAITQNGNSTLTISHASYGDVYIGDSGGVNNNTYINVNDNNSTITLNGAVTAHEITAASYILSSAGISAKTASYTLVATDNGKIITMNVATANNLTVPASLAVGFNCTVIQLGAGQTTIVASSTTLNSYQGYLKISGQHGSASIVSYTSNVYNVAGSLSA